VSSKAVLLKEGTDISILSNGETLFEAIRCVNMLEGKGINAELINVPVVKPLDEDGIIKSAKKTGAVVTVENHSVIGGLGSAVCECLSEKYPVPVKRIGVNDMFGQSGNQNRLMEEYGLTADKFIDKVVELVNKKGKM